MNEAKIVEECKNLFESITCLRVEGVEFFSQKEILDSICREATKGYDLCKNHLITENADHEHPAVSEGKTAKEIQRGYSDYLRAHRGR
ncbi:MAG: hypothetical protein BBJ57_07255 [Desulfobacterales bacterium PC51MH44]|nr:MAG: hypothetical protein BBJ57_07255 [Desulfobacterales bacterium PC51MH44]